MHNTEATQRRMPWGKLPRARSSLCLSWPATPSTECGEGSKWMASPCTSRLKHTRLAHGHMRRQHSQGSVRSSPLMTRRRTDVQGSVIMEEGCSSKLALPALPLAGLKKMADKWTSPLTHGPFTVHAHSRVEACSAAAQPIQSG